MLSKPAGAWICIVIVLMQCLFACVEVSMANSGKYIKKVGRLQNDLGFGAAIVRYRADGRHLAVTGSKNPNIYIYDLESMNLIQKLDKRSKNFGTEMSYDGNGRYLISEWAGPKKDAGYFLVWDSDQDYELISDDKKSVGGDYFYPAPDGKIMTSVSFPNKGKAIGKPKIWFYKPPEMIVQEHWHDLPGSRKIAISPDGKYMVDVEHEILGKFGIWDDRYHLRVWRYPDIELIKIIKDAHKHVISTLSWSWDSNLLLSNAAVARKSLKGDIKLWEVNSWKAVKQYKVDERGLKGQSFISDNHHILSVTRDPKIQLWDSFTGELVEELKLPKTSYVFTLVQNPVNKNHYALGYEDQIWFYEIIPPIKN